MSSNNSHHNPSSTLSASELLERQSKGDQTIVLDVREPIEFHTFNIGGINIPLSAIRERIEDLGLRKDEEIVVVCKVGLRSETAQSILKEMGYTQVKNLAGGLIAVQRLKQ